MNIGYFILSAVLTFLVVISDQDLLEGINQIAISILAIDLGLLIIKAVSLASKGKYTLNNTTDNITYSIFSLFPMLEVVIGNFVGFIFGLIFLFWRGD